MTNLFEETIRAMSHHDKKVDDIAWIGGSSFYIDLSTFIKAAKQTDYDSGYGAQEVAPDLIIAFNDGSWLSRGEYDGSEWWRYNYYPQKPKEKFRGKKIRLAGGMWDSLSTLNEYNEDD